MFDRMTISICMYHKHLGAIVIANLGPTGLYSRTTQNLNQYDDEMGN